MRNPTTPAARGHTKSSPVLAHSDRLTPEDLLLDAEARTIWRTITEDRDVMRRVAAGPLRWVIYRLRRESHRCDPLELIARIIVWLANYGVTEAKLRTIPVFTTQIIEECFSGTARRSLDEIDRDEQLLESRENQLALERRLVDPNPDQLEHEAAVNEQEAAVSAERARVLRREARRQRNTVLSFPTRPALT